MKAVKLLGHEQLVDIVETLQALLYYRWVKVAGDNVEVFDPDSEWSGADVCEAMAGKLKWYKLVPEFLGDEPDTRPPRCDVCGGSH